MTGQNFVMNSWDFPDGHCVKSVHIRSYSGPYFSVFGLNTDQNEKLRLQAHFTQWTGRDYYDRSRFSWQVKIFMTIGQDFKIVSIAIVIEVVWFQRCFQWWDFWHNLIEYPFFNLSSKLLFWKCVTYIGGVALILSKGH